jgi:hypothetical protein
MSDIHRSHNRCKEFIEMTPFETVAEPPIGYSYRGLVCFYSIEN